MVYDDAEKLYAEVRQDAETMLDDALDVILGGAAPAAHATALDQLVAYNTTFFPRREVVRVPTAGGLRTQVAQLSADGKEGYTVVDCAGGAHPVRLQTTPITEAWGFSPVSGVSHQVLHACERTLTWMTQCTQTARTISCSGTGTCS